MADSDYPHASSQEQLRQDFQRLEARLSDQIDRQDAVHNAAIEASLKSMDVLRRAGMVAAIVLAFLGAFFTFIGIRTLGDVTTYAKNEVSRVITGEADAAGKQAEQIEAIKVKYEEAVAKADILLDEINERDDELSYRYKIALNTPTLNYNVLNPRLERAYQKYQEEFRNAESNSGPLFIHDFVDNELLNEATAVFSTLLTALEGNQNVANKVSRDTLFNAAADAFRLNLNSLGLDLVTAATKLGIDGAPIPAEHEARLLRAQIQLNRVSEQDVMAQIPRILEKSNPVNLHLVVSEMSNLASLTGSPEQVAKLLVDDLDRWDEEPPSYTLVVIGRLLGQSHLPSEWERGRCFVRLAAERWRREPRSVAWEAVSGNEIDRASAELAIDPEADLAYELSLNVCVEGAFNTAPDETKSDNVGRQEL